MYSSASKNKSVNGGPETKSSREQNRLHKCYTSHARPRVAAVQHGGRRAKKRIVEKKVPV